MTETIDRNTTDINQSVLTIIAETAQCDPSEITPDQHLVADLDFDSLELVELATDLEEVFELTIPDEAVDKLETVGDVQTYIAAHVNTT
ncbi:MAG: acyl carrier protein [Phycisphaerae bacterium]|jgi:acyl carrier protein|nr:acyl carrier protein [Phycisphaerae bacterium]